MGNKSPGSHRPSKRIEHVSGASIGYRIAIGTHSGSRTLTLHDPSFWAGNHFTDILSFSGTPLPLLYTNPRFICALPCNDSS